MGNLKTNAMRILDTSKIVYEIHTYYNDGEIDGIAVAGKINRPVEQVFKTLVTQGISKNYFVFVIPVNEELNLKLAAKSVCEKSIEMIKVSEINKVTGYIRGGCSPIGMKKKFKTVIHNSCLGFEKIIVSGGRIGYQIELSALDLIRLINGDVEYIIT